MVHRHTTPRTLALVVSLAVISLLAACEQAGPDASRDTDGSDVPSVPASDSAPAPAANGAPAADRGPSPTPSRGGATEDGPASTLSPAARSELEARLRAGLEERLRGSSRAGDADSDAPSMFTAETADALRSVTVDSVGQAMVDFHDLRPIIPNASASAGSTLLLSELNATVFRFPEIRSVEYRMEGSCDLFWEWLQYGCHIVTRPPSAAGADSPEPN